MALLGKYFLILIVSVDFPIMYGFGFILLLGVLAWKIWRVPPSLIYKNIPILQPHESSDMYILVFYKEHTNADRMKLNDDRDLTSEWRKYAGPDLCGCYFIFITQVSPHWRYAHISSGAFVWLPVGSIHHPHYVHTRKSQISDHRNGTLISPLCAMAVSLEHIEMRL